MMDNYLSLPYSLYKLSIGWSGIIRSVCPLLVAGCGEQFAQFVLLIYSLTFLPMGTNRIGREKKDILNQHAVTCLLFVCMSFMEVAGIRRETYPSGSVLVLPTNLGYSGQGGISLRFCCP